MRCSSCGLSPWERSQIHVSTGPGQFLAIHADVAWPLAVHPGSTGGGWILTHVPTGKRVGDPWVTRPAAVRAADRLLATVERSILANPDAGAIQEFVEAVHALDVEKAG